MKNGGVEITATPFEQVEMFLVRRITDGFEEIDIAGRTTDIFRWSGIGASQTHGEGQVDTGRQDLLHLDAVLPRIAEVVDIDETLQPAQGAGERHATLALHGRTPAIRIGVAEVALADDELVHMSAHPAHGLQYHDMEER